MGTLSVDKLMKTSTGAAEFTLPATDGTANQVMQTDGSGQLSLANYTGPIATDAVDSAQIAANAVGNSEMADDAVGVAELSATGTASATTFLRGDNAWQTPTGTGADTSLSNLVSAGADKIVKAWIQFNGTGTIAIGDSFNVTSITDLGTGNYTITWDTDFGNATYAVVGMALGTQTAVSLQSQAAGSCNIYTLLTSTGGATDHTNIMLIGIGDQ